MTTKIKLSKKGEVLSTIKTEDTNQIERTISITYRWWNRDEGIKPEHIPALEESAWERIVEMAKEGYTGGELCDNIRMTDDDPEDGIEYSGWWELKN